MYSTQLYFQSNRYHVIFTIVWNNEECIIFSVIDILCFDEDSSTLKKKVPPLTHLTFKVYIWPMVFVRRLIIHLSFVLKL